MGSDSSVLISVMMMVAVTATIVYDMLVNGRGRVARGARPRHARDATPRPSTPLPPPGVEAAKERAVVADFPTARVLPGTMEDDVIRELSERLATLRLLGFDYVRTAHPLFRDRETDAGAGVAAATAPSESAAVTVPGPPRRRRARHVHLRGTATLRLVVDRRAPLPGS